MADEEETTKAEVMPSEYNIVDAEIIKEGSWKEEKGIAATQKHRAEEELVPGKDTVIVNTDTTLGKHEMDKIVNKIVSKWNEIIKGFENTTITLCLMVKEMLNEYPDATIKDIMKEVRAHPDIKRFVSLDRIWQGMRLVKNKPDLIEYHKKTTEEKAKVPEEDKPYLKQDGEVFWEFYFELEKRPLSSGVKVMLEKEGKDEKWSWRKLKDKLYDYKDEMDNPGEFEVRKHHKAEQIKNIINVCKKMNLENVKKVLDYARNLQLKAFQKPGE